MADQEVRTKFTASDDVSPVIRAIGSSVERLNGGLSTLNKVGSLVGLGIGISSVAAIGTAAVSTINRAVTAYEGYAQQELKLVTIMRQRMGANQEMIDSIHGVINAQTQLGVVGGTAQRAGAQQVATFLKSSDSLNSLLPAMNNLAVQMHGYNVSAGDMVGIGNMVGKVMNGQVEALRRVGITMDENQASLLKTLPEQEKAALLAQIITQNVGKMNEEFAKTPEGQKIQATNRLAAAWTNLGSKIAGTKNAIEAEFANMQADTLNNVGNAIAVAFMVIASGVQIAVEGLMWFGTTVMQIIDILAPFVAIGAVIYGTYEAVTFVMAAYGVVTGTVATSTAALKAVETAALGIMIVKETVVKAVTTAMELHKAGMLAATIAQWALNVATMAFPGVWIAAIIAVVIGVIVALMASCGNLQDIFSSVWGTIVDIVTSAINIIIDGINLFIEAMNKAASLGQKLFHWDTNPIDKVQHVSGAGMKAAGNNLIYNGLGSLIPEIPKPDVPNVPGVPNNPDMSTNGAAGTGGAVKDNVAKISNDTGRIADKIDMTDEEIKELREMADKDTQINWREQHIRVEVNNDNKISSGIDIDGMTGNIVQGLKEALAIDREGVRT